MEEDERPSKISRRQDATDVTSNINESKEEEVTFAEDVRKEAARASPTQSPGSPPILPAGENNQPSNSGQDETIPEPEETVATTQDPIVAPPISKSQLKKLQRQQQFEATREARKIKRKEKRAARKDRARQAGDVDPVTAQAGSVVTENGSQEGDISTDKRKNRVHPVLFPITFLIDCSFDDLMTDKERVSLSSQLTRCHAANRAAPYRAFISVSSFSGPLKERFVTVLGNHQRGWKNVRFDEADFVSASQVAAEKMRKARYQLPAKGTLQGGAKVFEQDDEKERNNDNRAETIYLTSDSPDTLTELSPYSTYIIGGLVDRNRHKGICYQRAMDRGVKTAKLPIGDYMRMASRFVLTTNQVLEIMLRWLEYGDWARAFAEVIPKRKGGVLKEGEEVNKVLGGVEATEGGNNVAVDGNDDEDGGEGG